MVSHDLFKVWADVIFAKTESWSDITMDKEHCKIHNDICSHVYWNEKWGKHKDIETHQRWLEGFYERHNKEDIESYFEYCKKYPEYCMHVHLGWVKVRGADYYGRKRRIV